ncbi:Ig-like domain-containing protein [Ruminococcus sp.]|uniref:Ig-like domain-containing protein n=1 Tax=Ruminococcus sp. TaxID=41978 RepID=UPI002E818485|nr:Ig-like domain-containing protein [Ruminococcus sp.]MEE3439728.1 Ig-like domain-containing protein [Ruminococcus sp.]
MKKLISLLISISIIASSLCISYFAIETTENKNSIVSTADNSTPDEPITEVTSSPTEFSTESSTEQTTVSTTNTTSSSTAESSTEPTTTEPTDIKVISIKLNKVNCTIYNNQKVQLKAIVNPINAINKKVSWVSSNSQIATVDRNGKVKAIRAGKATVTATSTDGSNVSAKCVIKVVQRVNKVNLNKSVINLSKKGNIAKLNATILPNNAFKKSVIWKSNNTKVATVDKYGKIKATNKGITYVIARAKDGSYKFAKVLVVVGPKVQKITLNKSSVTLNRSTKNITYQLKKSIKNKNATYKAVDWYTSNKNIATVDINGKVTVLKKGTVTITVRTKDGSNKYAKCKITVKQLVTKLSYNSKKQAKEVYRNKTIKFNVIVTPNNANNKGIIYSSSNKKVATVTSKGIIKGIKEGTVTITAKAKDDSKKTVKLKVKIKKPPITINTKLSNNEFNSNKKYVDMYVNELNKYFESCGAVINPNLKGSSQYCVRGTSTFRNNTSIKDFMVSTIGLWTNRRATDTFNNSDDHNTDTWKNIKTKQELIDFENYVEKISCVIFDEYNPNKMLNSEWNGWKKFCKYTNSDGIVNVYVYAIPNGDYDYEVRMYWDWNSNLKVLGIPLVKE